MKIVAKKLIKYGIIIGIPVSILAALFEGVSHISTIIIYLYLFYILFDIGWSIKSKSARKKYIIYMGVIVSVIALLTILGNIFGFKTYVSSETENTILDAASVTVIFAVIIGIFIKIIKDNKEKFPAVKLLYIPTFAWGIGAILVWIVAF